METFCRFMKKYTIYILAFLLLSFTTTLRNQQSNLVLLPNSKLEINGESNVNRFRCVFDSQKLNDTMLINYERVGSKLVFSNTLLRLENKEFDCGGRGINRDFHKLLKTEVHPEIKMSLNSVLLRQEKDSVLANIEYEINGVKKAYSVRVFYAMDSDKLHISGNKTLNINNFKLQPPKKLLGIIKVKETINIDFDFYLKGK